MIYELKQNGFAIKADSMGAQLISLTDPKGMEYIWQRKEPYWEKCAPVLFPVVGRCRDGFISIEGKEYPMELHGFAHSMEFEMIEQTENSLRFRLTDSPETRKRYPYAFVLEVTHTLSDGEVYTEFSVYNSDQKEILFGIGGHPAFRCPQTEEEAFEDYVLDFGKPVSLAKYDSDEDTNIVLQTQPVLEQEQILPLKRELFLPDAMIFDTLPFDTVLLRNLATGHGVSFRFDNFATFAVWTHPLPATAPFLCLEPWNSMGRIVGYGKKIEEKPGIIHLPVGETFRCGYGIKPLV